MYVLLLCKDLTSGLKVCGFFWYCQFPINDAGPLCLFGGDMIRVRSKENLVQRTSHEDAVVLV